MRAGALPARAWACARRPPPRRRLHRAAPHARSSALLRRPKSNGTTDSQVVLSLRLSEAEVGKVVLDPKEYETSQWVEPEAVLAGHFHPALKFAVRALVVSEKMEELRAAAALGPSARSLGISSVAVGALAAQALSAKSRGGIGLLLAAAIGCAALPLFAHAVQSAKVAALARELVAESADGAVAEGTSEYRVKAPKLEYECDVTTHLA